MELDQLGVTIAKRLNAGVLEEFFWLALRKSRHLALSWPNVSGFISALARSSVSQKN